MGKIITIAGKKLSYETKVKLIRVEIPLKIAGLGDNVVLVKLHSYAD